jgi:excisionase family DNA binding protein
MHTSDTFSDLLRALDRHIRKTIDERVKEHLETHSAAKAPQILTQEKACNELGISRSTLTQWRKEGRVPYHRQGKRIFFDRVELLNSMKSINGKRKPKR